MVSLRRLSGNVEIKRVYIRRLCNYQQVLCKLMGEEHRRVIVRRRIARQMVGGSMSSETASDGMPNAPPSSAAPTVPEMVTSVPRFVP